MSHSIQQNLVGEYAVEVKEQHMRMYNFDYKKACMSVGDFTYEALNWPNIHKILFLLTSVE